MPSPTHLFLIYQSRYPIKTMKIIPAIFEQHEIRRAYDEKTGGSEGEAV